MDGHRAAWNSIRGIKAQLVGLELVRNCVGDIKQKHICLAVIEEELCALDAHEAPILRCCSMVLAVSSRSILTWLSWDPARPMARASSKHSLECNKQQTQPEGNNTCNVS